MTGGAVSSLLSAFHVSPGEQNPLTVVCCFRLPLHSLDLGGGGGYLKRRISVGSREDFVWILETQIEDLVRNSLYSERLDSVASAIGIWVVVEFLFGRVGFVIDGFFPCAGRQARNLGAAYKELIALGFVF
ncbi:hypothetical protein Taro_009636 [Colocasia esculenta]|uniref:Uncharacterized protein n=1 Tax=Colocasia esculenta TaxID=4460 RepID=A0A843U101_COLES|nr:hypothetical protein [Colocasia esculenta]